MNEAVVEDFNKLHKSYCELTNILDVMTDGFMSARCLLKFEFVRFLSMKRQLSYVGLRNLNKKYAY